MTMYLVNKDKALLGTCVEHVDGWRFLPNVSSRKPSRKAHKSATAAIPRWAFNMSDDLLTLDEWKSTKAAR